MRRAALLYTVGRFGLFGLVAILLWSATGMAGRSMNGLTLLLVSALVSSALGYVLFAPQRRALAEAIEEQRQAKAAQVAERRARIDNES